MSWVTWTLPLVTAAIGWMTNWVAIKMLFHPRKSISICGWSLHGLIPKRKNELAAQIAEIVERELLSQHQLREGIMSVPLREVAAPSVKKLVHGSIAERLKAIPFVGGMINASTLNMFEELLLKSLDDEREALLMALSDEVERQFQVRHLIEEKIKAFDLDRLENIIHEVAKREFRTIEVLGALLGFLIGCLQLVFLQWL